MLEAANGIKNLTYICWYSIKRFRNVIISYICNLSSCICHLVNWFFLNLAGPQKSKEHLCPESSNVCAKTNFIFVQKVFSGIAVNQCHRCNFFFVKKITQIFASLVYSRVRLYCWIFLYFANCVEYMPHSLTKYARNFGTFE